MLKALLRKQMLEIRNVYLAGNRARKKTAQTVKNPKGMYILFGVLYLIIMGSMFAMSFGVGSVLLPAGLDWLYFTIMIVMALILGLIGSVLSTAQALFHSKDNELLLAMPIPPSRIIFVRMISVFLMALVYEGVVLIPAVIYYLIAGSPSFLGVVFSILGILVMAFLITAFSCAAGWLVSYIASKLKNQKIILVILAVLLIGVIYYFQFNSSRIIQSLLLNAESIAETLHSWRYPFYAPGLGMAGDPVGFLVFLAYTAVLFGIAYFAVTKSFSRIALAKEEQKQIAFKHSDIRSSKLADTLLRREWKRFSSSVVYMMNAGLGSLILLAAAVIVFIKADAIRDVLGTIPWDISLTQRLLPVLAISAICLLSALCLMASCSISLEGKYLWIYQSMPIDPYRIFLAKIKLHVILTGIPALLSVLAVGIVLGVSIPLFICMILYIGMFIILSASFQLMMDIRKPKTNWTNETQALKTNVTVFIDMLLGAIVPIALGMAYWILAFIMGPELYLAIWFVIFAVITLLIHKWLANKGRAIFRVL